MSNLQLIKSKKFNGIKCDFYKNENQEILLTRQQIGEALGYKNPQNAIDVLHSRHKERLDKFSVTVTLTGADEKLYDTTLYTFKGLYEICRYSKQPIANAFIDFAWDVIEEIRKTGSYTLPNKPTNVNVEAILTDPDTIIKLATNWKQEKEKRQQLEQQLQLQEPKVKLANQFLKNPTPMSMNTVAKVLNIPGIGRNKLLKYLRDNHIFTEENTPCQKYINLGYFKVKITPTLAGNKLSGTSNSKGILFLRDFIAKNPIQ